MQNLYILEGGINKWISVFGADATVAVRNSTAAADESPEYIFTRAFGSSNKLSNPVNDHGAVPENIKYTRKVKIQAKAAKSGGCG